MIIINVIILLFMNKIKTQKADYISVTYLLHKPHNLLAIKKILRHLSRNTIIIRKLFKLHWNINEDFFEIKISFRNKLNYIYEILSFFF